jgi:hypothetical protein
MLVTPVSFLYMGITMVSKDTVFHRKELKKKLQNKFVGSFGVSCDVVSHIWEYLVAYEKLDKNKRPKHLLWALFFMKTYETEAVLTQIFGATEKTIRTHVWETITAISNLYDIVVSDQKQTDIFYHLTI